MIKSIFKTLLLHFINFEYTDIIQISIISFVPFLSFSISLNWCLGLSIKAYSVLLSDNLLVKAKVDILYSTRLYRPVYFGLKKSNIDKHIISFNQSTSCFQEVFPVCAMYSLKGKVHLLDNYILRTLVHSNAKTSPCMRTM